MAYASFYPGGWKDRPDPSTPFNAAVATHWDAELVALDAAVTALQTSSAGVGELTATALVLAGWTSGTSLTRWVAPYACKVLSAQVMRNLAIAVDAVNYWQLAIKRISANVAATMVTKKTSDEALAANTGWSFDGAVWTLANQTLAKGDGIQVTPTNVGTQASTVEFVVTLVVQPL